MACTWVVVVVRARNQEACVLAAGRVLALKADVWRDKKEFFNAQNAALMMNGLESNKQERAAGAERILRQFWTSCVGDLFGAANLILTQAAFPDAMAVVDQVHGWRAKKTGT